MREKDIFRRISKHTLSVCKAIESFKIFIFAHTREEEGKKSHKTQKLKAKLLFLNFLTEKNFFVSFIFVTTQKLSHPTIQPLNKMDFDSNTQKTFSLNLKNLYKPNLRLKSIKIL